jgi:acetoin utilization protein AcuB
MSERFTRKNGAVRARSSRRRARRHFTDTRGARKRCAFREAGEHACRRFDAAPTLGPNLAASEAMSKPIPPISKYMTTSPRTAEGSATLASAAKIMNESGIRHLPVVEGEKLLGIITDRDIRFVESFQDVDPEELTLDEAMTEDPYTVSPDTPLDEVATTMAEQKYGSALVVQNEHIVGVFTTVDACRALAELLSTRLRK